MRAIALRGEGKTLREIGEELGVSLKTICEWTTDPKGARRAARRAGYAGSCEHCGGPTDGSDGPGKAAQICDACYRERNAERNARILDAWSRGEPAKVIAAREGIAPKTVQAFIDFRRRTRGESIARRRRRDREAWNYIQRRWNEGATTPQIAAELETSPANVSMMIQAMRAAGVDVARRIPARRAAA